MEKRGGPSHPEAPTAARLAAPSHLPRAVIRSKRSYVGFNHRLVFNELRAIKGPLRRFAPLTERVGRGATRQRASTRNHFGPQRAALKEIFSIYGFLSVYINLFFRISSLQARMKREFETFSFNVASATDARAAYTKWMESSTSHEAAKTLFDEKTKQLERIESRMDEGERPGLTTLPSGGFFTATYVMRFDRKLFEPRKYQVGFEIAHSQGEGQPQTASVATSVQISPYPVSLSLVAIISALLGVLVRTAVAPESQPFAQMFSLAQSGQLLVGPIVALIFFNIYEYTAIGKEMLISVSWRSALLIGALSGLAHDRMLAAIKALIGA